MKYGVINVRANTIRFMLTNYDGENMGGSIKKHYVTQLSEGVSEFKMLSEQGMRRAVGILGQCVAQTEAAGAKPLAFVTSVLRDAENISALQELCRNELKMDIDLLSPQQEAEASLIGASGGTGRLIAVGAGYTTIASGHDGNMEKCNIIPMGAEKAMQEFGEQDDSLFKLRNWVFDKEGAMLHDLAGEDTVVYAISGTATAMAVLSQFHSRYATELAHGYNLKANSLAKASELLGTMAVEERMQLPVLFGRARAIRYGAAILLACMEGMGVDSVRISDADAMEGYLIRSVRAEKT